MILVEKKNLDRKIFSNCPVNEFIFWNLNWFLGNLKLHEKKSKTRQRYLTEKINFYHIIYKNEPLSGVKPSQALNLVKYEIGSEHKKSIRKAIITTAKYVSTERAAKPKMTPANPDMKIRSLKP